MKKYYLFAGLVLLAASPALAQTKIGAAGAPDASAMLEVTSGASSNKGLLLPKMTTVQRNAIVSPATGLMIYNTTTNEAQVNTGTPALPTWVTATATATGWATNGNTGTTPATNFIGTTDNQPLVVRTDNTEKVRVTSTGNVGIGTNAPVAKLQVVDTANAAIVVSSGSASGTTSVNLGNGHHGITRNLTNAGGDANDVALFTTSGSPTSPASIHLGVRANVTDTLDLNQFVLKNTGYVGIGINTPAAKLHIFDTADVAMRLVASNGKRTRIELGNGSHGIARNLYNSGGLGNDLALYTSSGPDSLTEGTLYLAANPIASDSIPLTQFALKKNGNLGIGIRVPTAKLHVNGGGLTVTNSAPMSAPAINVISDNGGGLNPDNVSITAYGVSNPIYGISVARGTAAAPQNSQAGDNTGSIFFAPRINGAFSALSGMTSRYLGDGTTNKSALHFLTSNTTAMTIDSSGKVGIGTTSPRAALDISGGVHVLRDGFNPAISNGSLYIWNTVSFGLGQTEFINYKGTGSGGFSFYNVAAGDTADASDKLMTLLPTGGIIMDVGGGTYNPVTGTWTNGSDRRYKNDIRNIKYGLSTVMNMQPRSYTIKASGVEHFGFIAQELKMIVPEAVSVQANGYMSVDYANLTAVLTKAIQEQQAQIEALKAKNEQLEATNKVTAQLMERVKQMEQMMGINEIEGTSKVAGK